VVVVIVDCASVADDVDSVEATDPIVDRGVVVVGGDDSACVDCAPLVVGEVSPAGVVMDDGVVVVVVLFSPQATIARLNCDRKHQKVIFPASN
jgi:hypothetical protein